MRNRILFAVFLGVVAIQIFFVLGLSWREERVLEGGTLYKFKTAPVDPSNPMMGKYLQLNFGETSYRGGKIGFNAGDPAYVTVHTGEDGFAYVTGISREPFRDSTNYFQVKIKYEFNASGEEDYPDYLQEYTFPFDKFFITEDKAKKAEMLYRENQGGELETYAAVMVKDGRATLKDLVIDGKSVNDAVGND